MKRIFKVALLCAMVLSTSMVSAQKMGRINVQGLIMSMPETTTMQGELETIRQDFADNLETMQVELNNKLNDFQKSMNTMTDSIRSMKEKEMQDLNLRMQQFEQNAMQEIQAKQNQLLEPIIAKAREAIKEVATLGEYDVVFDESGGALAFYDESKVMDLTAAVRLKLGIMGSAN